MSMKFDIRIGLLLDCILNFLSQYALHSLHTGSTAFAMIKKRSFAIVLRSWIGTKAWNTHCDGRMVGAVHDLLCFRRVKG